MTDLIQDLPELVTLSNRTSRNLTKFIEGVEETHKNGGLLKSQLKDIKYHANMFMEKVWDDAIREKCLKITSSEVARDFFFLSSPAAHNLKSFQKKIDALDVSNEPDMLRIKDDANELMSYFGGIASEFDALKDMVKTQAELKQTEPKKKDEFEKPLPSRTVVKQIESALRTAMSGVEEVLTKNIRDMMTDIVDKYFESVDLNTEKLRNNSPYAVFKQNPFAKSIAGGLLDPYSGEHTHKGVFGKTSDFDEKLEKKVSEQVNFVIQSFIGKQLQKIPGVVESLGRPSKISVSVDARSPIEGSVGVEMENGASFMARTQVVFGVSPNGVFFSRYPTTFHDVYGPDKEFAGKKLSEKQMYSLAPTSDSLAP